MTPALLAGLTGVVQGARHALEPDHVTAVATVMASAPSARRGLFYAACWGLGHASMLLLVGGPLLLFRAAVPTLVTVVLELAVGAMLVYLGVRTLREAHAPTTAKAEPTAARRPFAIGVVHGLAGSGALAALIALGSPSTMLALTCLTLYAIGTVLGMVALAALAGPLLARAGKLWSAAVIRVAGVASVLVGVAWVARALAGV